MSQSIPAERAPALPALTSLRTALVMILLCGGVYPLTVTALGNLLFPEQATGSLLTDNGAVVGSRFAGQSFQSDHYLHGRPSAAGYDPFSAGGSNLAVSNPDLRERAEQASQALQTRYNVLAKDIPVDMLTASGSGLDPHISPESAHLQAERIAQARKMPVAEVHSLIEQHTEGPELWLFGQPRVHVLQFNLDLDARKSMQ